MGAICRLQSKVMRLSCVSKMSLNVVIAESNAMIGAVLGVFCVMFFGAVIKEC